MRAHICKLIHHAEWSIPRKKFFIIITQIRLVRVIGVVQNIVVIIVIVIMEEKVPSKRKMRGIVGYLQSHV